MRLGSYDTVMPLGRGGMADLYLGRSDAGEVVVLKTLRSPAAPSQIAMFLEEARFSQLLDHPNVVHTRAAGVEGDVHFIAMEYLDGQPLDSIVGRLNGRVDAPTRDVLVWVLTEALAGLHYAHELTEDGAPLLLVHRDVSPQNLFVTLDGRVKVLDFGIAKATSSRVTTTEGTVKGKVRFMAPEHANGLRVDRRADVFAAGVLLYELLGGTPFWPHAMRDREIFERLVAGDYPTSLPNQDSELNEILSRSLARDPLERWSTALAMRNALRTVLEERRPGADFAAMTRALIATLFPTQADRTSKLLAYADRSGPKT